MNHDQIIGMLERDVRAIVQQMLVNNQITAQHHNYVLNEWNMNRNHLANLAYTKYNAYGGPNPQQINAIAMNFINTAMANFNTSGGRPGGMMGGQPRPMYGGMGGAPMYAGMGAIPQNDPYGGMYGNTGGMYGNGYSAPQYNPGTPEVTECPYSAALESDTPVMHTTPAPQTPTTATVTAQPVQQASSAPALFNENPETSTIFNVEMVTLEPEAYQDDTAAETLEQAKTTDVGDIQLINRNTENVYNSDIEALTTEKRHFAKQRCGEIYTLSYNRSAMYQIPRSSFKNFQEFLEKNIDRDACSNTKDYRGMMKSIIKEVRTNIENVSMKVGTMLENLVVKLINDRGYTGNFAGSGEQYQLGIKNLDELLTMDNPDRGLKVLLAVIDEIKRYDILDLNDKDSLELIEDIVPEKFNIEALHDLTDKEVIKSTIEEVDNELTFVIFKRVIYQFSRIPVPLVIKGATINPTVSPTFKGTPDTTFEYFLNNMFDRDFNSYNPIRAYMQPTPNIIIAFVVAQTTDNAIRLCPASV